MGKGVRVDAGQHADDYDELPREGCGVENLQEALVFEGDGGAVGLVGHVREEEEEQESEDGYADAGGVDWLGISVVGLVEPAGCYKNTVGEERRAHLGVGGDGDDAEDEVGEAERCEHDLEDESLVLKVA